MVYKFTVLFNYSQKVRNFCNNTTHRGIVRSLNSLVEFGHSETLDDFLLLFRIAYDASVILDLDVPALFVF